MGPQRGLGVALQDPLRAVERLVDRLHRDSPAVLDVEDVGDLFREIALDESTQLGVDGQTAVLR